MPVEILNYSIATAGHEGHGKTSLLKALSGNLPAPKQADQDLKYSAMRLKKYHLSIVDIPGAQKFVGQMVAGVGAIDIAMLAVAANEGWMAQTQEHFEILCYLGIERAIVAITKIDLVKDFDAVVKDVTARLKRSPMDGALVIPTSIRRGQSIVDLKTGLGELLARMQPRADWGKPRLAVENCDGNSVSGMLIGGSFEVGQEIVLAPDGSTARIVAARASDVQLQLARPGARIDIELSGLKAPVARGCVVTVAEG